MTAAFLGQVPLAGAGRDCSELPAEVLSGVESAEVENFAWAAGGIAFLLWAAGII